MSMRNDAWAEFPNTRFLLGLSAPWCDSTEKRPRDELSGFPVVLENGVRVQAWLSLESLSPGRFSQMSLMHTVSIPLKRMLWGPRLSFMGAASFQQLQASESQNGMLVREGSGRFPCPDSFQAQVEGQLLGLLQKSSLNWANS